VTSVPRTFLIALGLTSLYLLFMVKPLLEPSQYYFYHWSGSPGSLFLPIIANFLAFWLLITLLLLFARKRGRRRVAILSGLVLLTSCVYTHLNIFYHRLPSLNLGSVAFVLSLLITVFLTVMWRPDRDARYEHVFSHVITILSFLGIFGLFILFNLAHYGWRAYSIVKQSTLHQPHTSATAPEHRTIWIVFDELSQDQVYTHRFPGLQLPAFDSLAASSTEFTNVVPPNIATEIVLPGLIMGIPFDGIKTSSSGIPNLHDPDTRSWQHFDQYDTVFQDALHSGYSTAAVGWYNPYCRLLSHVLDKCFWTYRFRQGTTLLADHTPLWNTLLVTKTLAYSPFVMLPNRVQPYFARLLRLPPVPTGGEAHLRDYLDLAAATDRSLRDRSASFLFLHLPVPHPDNIYDRKSGSFVTVHSSSYIDNLALADKCLANIRATLEQTGQWDSSTIVIMGDHSWRTTQIWRRNSIWRPEDERASNGGQFDNRPAYLVKLPGQTTPARIDFPFHSAKTRILLDQLMTNRITTPTQLSAWAQTAR
jgi:hypothetical protein